MGRRQVWMRAVYKASPIGKELVNTLEVCCQGYWTYLCFSFSRMWTVSLKPHPSLEWGGGSMLDKCRKSVRKAELLSMMLYKYPLWGEVALRPETAQGLNHPSSQELVIWNPESLSAGNQSVKENVGQKK